MKKYTTAERLQIESMVKDISPKYKNIINLNKWWIDYLWIPGTEHKEYPVSLSPYWVADYRDLDSLDRITVLRKVVCNDFYDAEQAARSFRFYKVQEPYYHNKFEEIMKDKTPETIIPDTINHEEFYAYESELCRMEFLLPYGNTYTIRLDIHWNESAKSQAEHSDDYLITVNPPWGTDYLYFSLEELENAILYAQTHGRSIGVSNTEFNKIVLFVKGTCPFCRQKLSKYNQIGAWYIFPLTSTIGIVIEKYKHRAMPMCAECHRIWKPAWDRYCRISERSLRNKDFVNNLDNEMKMIFDIEGITGRFAYARKITKVKKFLQKARSIV